VPRPPAGSTAAVFDVFVVRLGARSREYLAPTGAWSLTPIAYRRGGVVTPIRAEWKEPGPTGEIILGVTFTRPGAADDRSAWVFAPLYETRTVRRRPRLDLINLVGTGGAAVATLAALALVVALPGRRHPGSAQEPAHSTIDTSVR
jgi:hypothetical protein